MGDKYLGSGCEMNSEPYRQSWNRVDPPNTYTVCTSDMHGDDMMALVNANLCLSATSLNERLVQRK